MMSILKNTYWLLFCMFFFTGCATIPQVDYSAFRQSNPKSILVLPPVNRSPDVKASYSFLSHTSYPLAESGYYVFPVAVVEETFRQNGLTTPDDIHAISPAKLREIFGADTALYIEVTDYGTKYMVISSATVVTANARLVDLKTGTVLWTGQATASDNQQQNNNAGLVGLLIQAAVTQVINSSLEQGHMIAGVASQQLLSANSPRGILYGPRSPQYQKDKK
jgi:hypothetical protein